MSAANVEVVRELFQLWEQRDHARAGERFAPDLVFTRIGEGLGDVAGEWHGLDVAWQAMADFFRAWEDLRQEPRELIDLDDQVFALVRQTGRGRASGITVEHELAYVFTLRAGKVTRWDLYWDPGEARRATGQATR